MTSSQIAVQRG